MQYETIIPEESIPYVHHMVVHICDGLEEEDMGAGGLCSEMMNERLQFCLHSIVVAAWAFGGTDVSLFNFFMIINFFYK